MIKQKLKMLPVMAALFFTVASTVLFSFYFITALCKGDFNFFHWNLFAREYVAIVGALWGFCAGRIALEYLISKKIKFSYTI